ncbi:DDE transposase [Paenibacillus sp. sptzw28]|uniref:transposase n=1 Tax=Paenibacillus sp. sptzw28 TaxID=715179 RepID=UPI001C6F14C7|nr:transposase [Paenibacillus sp. sptzw28]QYR20184.1 DDE transposase [Paenibacillus sp. sptzw28]
MISDGMSFADFSQRFNCEKVCIDVLYAAKWPDGYRCPRCNHCQTSKIKTRRLPLYECRICHYQASLISGTVMEGSRTHLHKWFQALFLIACPSSSINAVKLSAIINVTYKTAWLILHKLRHAMSHGEIRHMLAGMVRIKTAFYGKPYNPSFSRHPQEHPLISGAAFDDQGEITHIKIKQVDNQHMTEKYFRRTGVDAFISNHVQAFPADITIESLRFHTDRFRPVLRICKEVGNWMNAVFHGIGGKHLQAYLDEFCFRLNNTFRKQPVFNQLFLLCASTAPITYKELIRKNKLLQVGSPCLSAA